VGLRCHAFELLPQGFFGIRGIYFSEVCDIDQTYRRENALLDHHLQKRGFEGWVNQRGSEMEILVY
jgi:hypothetical protein